MSAEPAGLSLAAHAVLHEVIDWDAPLDEYDVKAHAVLDSLPPEARDVMERQGRYVSDRMAAERQLRRDMKEARDDIHDEWVRRGYHAGPSFAELQRRRYGPEL